MIQQLGLSLLLLAAATAAFSTAPLVSKSSETALSFGLDPAAFQDLPQHFSSLTLSDGAVEAVSDAMEAAAPAVSEAVAAVSEAVSAPAVVEAANQKAAGPDLDIVALVAGQENYGLAVVCVGEALWSFFQAPSFDHAKVLVPAAIAALLLGVVSGPMITSGDAATVSTGLFIATGVSIGLGASYVARLAAPFSPSSKEIAALGLLVAIAGFFSFSQNLVVDGFVTLPSIPLPDIHLPTTDWGDLDERP